MNATIKALGYPTNLLRDVFSGEEWVYYEITQDQIDGLEMAINDLPERERMVVDLRYRKEMTLDEVGKAIGLTRERVRQIALKVGRRLKNPVRMERIRHGVHGAQMMAQREQEEFIRTHRMVEVSVSPTDHKIIELSLSSRAFNALDRAEIESVGQLVEMSLIDLLGVKNVGIKTAIEIINARDAFLATAKPYTRMVWVER